MARRCARWTFHPILLFTLTFSSLFVGRADAAVVPVGVLFPLTGPYNDSARPMIAAMRLAEEQINLSAAILPNHTLQLEFADTEADAGVGFRRTLEMTGFDLNNTARNAIRMALGPRLSSVSMNAGLVAREFNFPLLSPTSTAHGLADRTMYPTFSRTVPSDNSQAQALAQLVKHFGWRRVSLVYTTTSYASQLASELRGTFSEMDVSVVSGESFQSGATDISTQVGILKAARTTINILLMHPSDALTTFRALDLVDMLNGEYLYLGVDSWIEGHLSESGFKLEWSHGTMGTIGFVDPSTQTYQAYLDKWNTAGDHISAVDPTTYSAFCYDAVMLAAKAMDRFLTFEEDCNTQAVPNADCADPQTKLLQLLRSTPVEAHEAVTGAFTLCADDDVQNPADCSGERTAQFGVINVVNGQPTTVGAAHPNDGFRLLDDSFLTWPNGSTHLELTWPDSLPDEVQACTAADVAFTSEDECGDWGRIELTYSWKYESDPSTHKCFVTDYSLPGPESVQCHFVAYGSGLSYTLLLPAALVAVVATGLLVCVVALRTNPVLLRAQPVSLASACVGVVLTCAAVLVVLGRPSDASCALRPVLFTSAWFLLFGGVYVILFRLFQTARGQLFVRKAVQRLRMFLGGLVALNAIVIALWLAFARPRPTDRVQSTGGGGQLLVSTCSLEDGTWSNAFTVTLVFVNGLWTAHGVYLMWYLRGQSGTAKQASLAMLLYMVLGGASVALLSLNGDEALSIVASQFCLLIGALLCLLLLTVPRLLLLFTGDEDATTPEWSSLYCLLENSITRSYFHEFLDKSYSGESLRFLNAVSDFREQLATADTDDELSKALRMVDNIRDAFILEGSPQEINIPSSIRQKALREIREAGTQQAVANNLFAPAEEEIMDLLYHNFFHQFQQNVISVDASRTVAWSESFKLLSACVQKGVMKRLLEMHNESDPSQRSDIDRQTSQSHTRRRQLHRIASKRNGKADPSDVFIGMTQVSPKSMSSRSKPRAQPPPPHLHTDADVSSSEDELSETEFTTRSTRSNASSLSKSD